MYSISLANYKGGVGKSTTAIHLAVAAAQRRLTVAIVDADEQRSIASWASLRDRETPLVVQARARDLPSILQRLRRTVDLCLVDCPGHDWRALAVAIASVDLTVIVGRPTLLDVDVSTRVRDLLSAYNLPHAFLLSQLHPQHGARFLEWAAAYSVLGSVIDPPISSRVGFQDALKRGQGITEYAPDSRAADEIERVLDWIIEQDRGRR